MLLLLRFVSREALPMRNVYWSRPSVCPCVCLYPSPHSHTTARIRNVSWGMVWVPLAVHYGADLQSVHGFRYYDNITPNAKYQRVLVLALCLFIIRPHRSTTYVDAAYCYRPSTAVCRSVCLSACHTSEPCKRWLNRSRYHLGPGLGWAQGTMH